MKYWFDTEFIDDTHTIDLISIGIVNESDDTYYAVSSEFSLKKAKADAWLNKNVLSHLPEENIWKPRQQIRGEILEFIGHNPEFWVYNGAYDWVIFCQLFGHIRDLPKTYPWYANDIKQLAHFLPSSTLPEQLEQLKHNALEDAKWNKQAWQFLMENNQAC